MAKFKYLFIPSTQNLVSLPHLLNIIKCNSVCCLTWSMALGLPHPPCQDLQTRLTGHHWPPPGGEWCPVSPWQIQGRSLQRCGGWAPRTKLLATNDQVLCVSVCQSIWIFTSRAGDSFNFKSPANNVWSSECFHHWASTYTATCTGFVRARVVSQQSLPILCRNCSRRIVSLPVLILA